MLAQISVSHAIPGNYAFSLHILLHGHSLCKTSYTHRGYNMSRDQDCFVRRQRDCLRALCAVKDSSDLGVEAHEGAHEVC